MPAGVVITGVGALTALGADTAALVAALADGRCAIGPLTLFSYAGRSQTAAQIPEVPAPTFGPSPGLPLATLRRLTRPDRFALAAALEACRAAGLEPAERRGAAVFVGATVGGMFEVESEYAAAQTRRFRTSRLLGMGLPTAGAVVAQALGAYGPQSTFSTACSSSALAIAMAAETIARGEASVAIALGTDGLCRTTYAGFDALQAIDPERCRPFDRDRRGLSLGEGAAALVLEDAAHARARGARVRAVLCGHGSATDAHHPTAPHPEGAGALAALRAALADAGVVPEAVDYVNAHGTGTRQNDVVEIGVLRAALGPRLARVPVSSTKSQLGHCLGAAGAIEAVACVEALAHGIVPPTAGLAHPDPEWADLDLVPVAGRRAALGVALSSSYGFGGHNVTLVLARPEAA